MPSGVRLDTPGVVFRVALQYPNGRTHDAVLDRVEAPMIGTVFEMYRRTWRVNGIHDSRASSGRPRRVDPSDKSLQYVCVCVNY